jgi:voltage-gated potassium channel
MTRRARLELFLAASEMPVAVLALLIAPAIVLQSHARSVALREVAYAANWSIWLALCGECVLKLWFAADRRRFLRTAWVDLLIVALSAPVTMPGGLEGTAAARLIGMLRFARGATVAAMGLRLVRHILHPGRFHYVALTTLVVVGFGALGIFAFEGGTNVRIRTFGDAIWWSVVTATTVGYGDVSPVTIEGRVIAVGLMLLGIGFIGIFTATVSNVFFDQGRVNDVEARLARIEAKLDAVAAAKSA